MSGLFGQDKTTDKDELIVRVAGDGDQLADVNTYSGVQKLETNATVVVEEVFGQDDLADSWYRIENAGNTNDTHTITIAATTNDPSSPDRDRPLYTKTITTTASEAGDEIALRDKAISELNADSNFNDYFKAIKVKDNAIVHISSKFRGEFWEVTGADDFNVTTTGSVSVTRGFDTLERRGKPTSLARDPDNARIGILGISGSVQVTPGTIGELYFEHAEYSGSKNMLVDGSSTPVVFTIPAIADNDIFIEFLRFHGRASSIKFGQFLAIAKLTNGIDVEIRSDNEVKSLNTIHETDDFFAEFNVGSPFELFDQPGAAVFKADFSRTNAIVLRATGTFATDDYVKVTINDDLDSVSLQVLELQAVGFTKEV